MNWCPMGTGVPSPGTKGGRRASSIPKGSPRGRKGSSPSFSFPWGFSRVGSMRQRGHHAVEFIGRLHFDDPDILNRSFVFRPGAHEKTAGWGMGRFFWAPTVSLAPSLPAQEKNRVQEVAEKMKAVFQGVEDYSFRGGTDLTSRMEPEGAVRFKILFQETPPNPGRVHRPPSGVDHFYQGGESRPPPAVPFDPSLQFNLSIDSSILKTPPASPSTRRIWFSSSISFPQPGRGPAEGRSVWEQKNR